MRYLSVCSGIEAASVAWHDFGWTPVGFSEIEKFPSEVLSKRFPDVTNYGDMTRYKEWDIDGDSVDLLVGGTPCQAFSVAGLRKGLEDPRGNLTLTFVGMVDHFKPEWVVWENVPGVLSSNGGRDFGSFIGAMASIGYGFAWRCLDAQFYGVPQHETAKLFAKKYPYYWAGQWIHESLHDLGLTLHAPGNGLDTGVGQSQASYSLMLDAWEQFKLG